MTLQEEYDNALQHRMELLAENDQLKGDLGKARVHIQRLELERDETQLTQKLDRQIIEIHRKDKALAAAKRQNTQVRRELEESRKNHKVLKTRLHEETVGVATKHKVQRADWDTERETYLDKINAAERAQGVAEAKLERWHRFYSAAMDANDLNSRLLECLARRATLMIDSYVVAGLHCLRDKVEVPATKQAVMDLTGEIIKELTDAFKREEERNGHVQGQGTADTKQDDVSGVPEQRKHR